MEFILTKHARQKIYERRLPTPEQLNVQIVKNRLKSLVLKQCPKRGYNKNLVYWRSNETQKEKIPVYVCAVVSVGIYKVITAFNLITKVMNTEENKKKADEAINLIVEAECESDVLDAVHVKEEVDWSDLNELKGEFDYHYNDRSKRYLP